jgi:hypothetical protein
MPILYLFFFPLGYVQTILAYVLSAFLLFGIMYFFLQKKVSVVVARRRTSVPNDLAHMSLYLGGFIKWQYSRGLPVSLLRTDKARSQGNCSGYHLEDAYFAVNGALYPGISMH